MSHLDLLKKIVELEASAAAFGLQWENTSQIMDQIKSECFEIDEHLQKSVAGLNQTALQEEIGDLLHAVFSLCVFCQFDPEMTLKQTLLKFERRLNAVQAIAHEQGRTHLKGLTFDELMDIWRQAKKQVG